jgi:hypothetical protein
VPTPFPASFALYTHGVSNREACVCHSKRRQWMRAPVTGQIQGGGMQGGADRGIGESCHKQISSLYVRYTPRVSHSEIC